jgi:hypothetical protein
VRIALAPDFLCVEGAHLDHTEGTVHQPARVAPGRSYLIGGTITP